MSSAGGSATPSVEPEKKASKKPAKRARPKNNGGKADTKAPLKRRGRQGCLSVLPTLPMDLLYEIFGHLGPADLLSLARTTKSFRNILMARQSAFIWRSVLDAASEEGGHPPRPVDMAEPAWTNLVFGGGKCELCGSKTSKGILWMIRKRLCKGCRDANLFQARALRRPEGMDPGTRWEDVLPADPCHYIDRHLISHLISEDWRSAFSILEQDMNAYIDDLNTLRAAEGDFFVLRAQMDTERKARMLARYEHADACYAAEDSRFQSREVELDDLKKTRFEQIKSRLLDLGYDAVDMESREFQKHTEVRAPKPVTDRTWIRLGPIMKELVKGIRDRRLARERDQRVGNRHDVVEEEYNSIIMRAVPWSLVSFIPPVRCVWEFPGLENVKALVEAEDTEPSLVYRVFIRQALLSSAPAMQRSILSVAENLKTTVPQAWTFTRSTSLQPSLSHAFAHSEITIDLSPLASLDRAAYVFRCQDSNSGLRTRPIHFGLDGIAHECARRQENAPEPEDDLRSIMVQMLELLDLDPATATPLDLDQLAPVFVCTSGHVVTTGIRPAGIAFANWRDTVAHGDSRRSLCEHMAGPPDLRLASELEARYARAMAAARANADSLSNKNIVGCCHCTKHLELQSYQHHTFRRFQHINRQSWMTSPEIKEHLQKSHDIRDGVEGQDYFYDRRNPAARFDGDVYGESSAIAVSSGRHTAGSVRLPNVSASQLEAQVMRDVTRFDDRGRVRLGAAHTQPPSYPAVAIILDAPLRARPRAMTSARSASTSTTTQQPTKASKSPTKRTRKAKQSDGTSASQAPVKRRGRQGRLSVLPTLPMDLLYEIFAQLGPADLLSLARTTKSFRSILMSRQAAFIWRSVLDAASEDGCHPPRPDDMDEPAWANLVFGGGKCGLCEAKTPREVNWTLRIRLCRTCQCSGTLPIDAVDRPEEMDPKVELFEVIPSDAGRMADHHVSDGSRAPFPILERDLNEYIKELDALLDSADGNFLTLRAQMDEARKAKMAKRYKHADACYAAESERWQSRGVEIKDLKKTRFEQIKRRLLDMGYDTVDIDSLEFQHHSEVRVAKPVTDRMWKRLGPIVSAVVEKIRDRRLANQRYLRMDERQGVLEEEYNSAIMRAIPWSMVSFVPPVNQVWTRQGLEDVKRVLEDDANPSDDFRLSIRQTLLSSVPTMQQPICSAAEDMRASLPSSWDSEESSLTSPASLSHQFVDSEHELDLSPLASLDRVAFVFRCQDRSTPGLYIRPIHFGLDGIAHGCVMRQDLPPEPEHGLHSVVVQMLELLGLDPPTTTPLDVDRLAPVFVCTQDHADTAGVAFVNWRDAVAHGDTWRTLPDHKIGPPVFRLASDLEARYVRAMTAERARLHPNWGKNSVGCCHCTEHLAFQQHKPHHLLRHPQSWMTLRQAKKHLLTSHDTQNSVEGHDYYYDRRSPVARFDGNVYEKSASIFISGGRYHHPGSICLPEVTTKELAVLVLEKETAFAGS
ncbi:unnamed protein product [Peniophora sp. CBMAI 1063]|nr:unnamed protein product [Peniophora sp. CBMAI 1063]